ncbi:DNA-binding response regulator, OmpR family, contains REC and winged-helix (wHTH) domain [Rhizobium sp. AN5]|uniref:response regulator transcription factor n=1 Tax=Rhizobium sp. AN5 TaxID=1855304 RepID=UPI000BDD2AD1|nr:response regulator transcription factor [Rhizobium sp. AN5]SOC90473.1 DNA-binding response regulator, OmpR family, contains REC and winged-helix (wHTH) domain [Rhizobium sp. AN5]
MAYPNVKQSEQHQTVRVILVEDDFDLRQGVTDFLRLNAFAVTAVANGAEFEQAFTTDVFDIAIIDVNLPDSSGFDITRSIVEKSNLGIIILTARTLRDDKLRGYAEGANLYLTKPVDGDELVFAIRNLASRIRQTGSASGETPQPAANWFFDRAAQRLVSPQGAAIRLSGREAKLILCLATGEGHIVSRADIAQAMGYQDISPETRSLDAVLRRLRLKVRETGMELPVHVVHAVGFHFSGTIIIS